MKFELHFPPSAARLGHIPEPSGWPLDFNVADGKIPVAGIRNTYQPDHLTVTDRKTLRMDHRAGFELIAMNAPELLARRKGVLVAEWKLGYLGDDGENSSFQVMVAPANPQGKVWLGNVIFYEAKIVVPWGVVVPEAPLTGRETVFRLVIDLASGEGAFFGNGRKLGSGKIREHATLKPQIWFGDGSGRVGGSAELAYFKAAVLE